MSTATQEKNKIVEMLDNHETAMLVTHDLDGGLVSRPMTVQKPQFDGDLWFFVSSDATAIDEVKANSEVNVAFHKNGSFVSLSGHAEMVDDQAKKEELWYPELAKWFEGNGPESPDVRLIKVSADTGYYWTEPNGGSNSTQGENGSAIEKGKVTY